MGLPLLSPIPKLAGGWGSNPKWKRGLARICAGQSDEAPHRSATPNRIFRVSQRFQRPSAVFAGVAPNLQFRNPGSCRKCRVVRRIFQQTGNAERNGELPKNEGHSEERPGEGYEVVDESRRVGLVSEAAQSEPNTRASDRCWPSRSR